MYYVYLLLDPREPGEFKYGNLVLEYKPFYVGKGTAKRCYAHEKRVNRDLRKGNPIEPTAKARKIAKILKASLKPIVVKSITKYQSPEDAFELEKRLIKKIGRLDKGTGPLTNLTEGGEGAIEPMVSKKAKKKRAATQSTPEYKERWRRASKEYWASLTPEERELRGDSLRKAFANKTDTENKKRSKKISKSIAKVYQETDLSDRKKAIWAVKPEHEKQLRAERISKSWQELSIEDISSITSQRLATRKGWTKKQLEYYRANKDNLSINDCERLDLHFSRARRDEEYTEFKKERATSALAKRYAKWTEEDRKEWGRRSAEGHKKRIAAQQETLWFERYGNMFKQEAGRGLQVKQTIFCKKHKARYLGAPATTTGCDKCLLDMVKANTVPSIQYTEEMAQLHFKLRARYKHKIEEYRGSKTKPSLFSCLITGKTFESTLQRETEGGRTGCYHCKGRKKK